MQARSSVPERNKVRLRSFHTSLIDDYENGKRFEYDTNLPCGACTPIILQHQRNVIKFFVYETFFYVRSKSQRAFFLSFCEYHTVCVCKRLFGPKGLFLERFVNITRCGWVNLYVCKRLFGPKGSFLLERQSRSGSLPDQRSMLLKGKFL